MKLPISLVCVFLEYSISFTVENDVFKGLTKRKVAALGRTAHLGDLYDARTDNFLDISIHTEEAPKDAIRVTDAAASNIDYVRTESLSEKMDKLGVSPSLSISYLSGMVRVSGSAKYLNRNKKNSNSAKTSIIYSFRTVAETLKIFSRLSRELIDKSLLENVEATHVLVGIEWGTDIVLSLEETNTNSLGIRETQRKLEEASKLISAFGSTKLDFDIEESSSFSLNLHTDIVPNTVPQTINESLPFIRNIPKLISKEYNGKGKQMTYALIPLGTIENVLRLQNNKSRVVNYIDQNVVDELVQIFQEVSDSELHINQVYNDVNKWARMISESDYKNIRNIKKRFNSLQNDLKKKFSDLVGAFRKGELDKEAFKNFSATYDVSNLTPTKTNELLQICKPTMHKIDLMNLFKRFNALFIGRATDQHKILADNYEKELRILSVDLSMNISSLYVREIVKLLKAEIVKESEQVIKYYVKESPGLTVPSVQSYLNGNLINRFSVDIAEYVLLVSRTGKVIIMDDSFTQITTFSEPKELYYRTIAIANGTLYNIDTMAGHIKSTDIKNVVTLPKGGIKWDHVSFIRHGSDHMHCVAAVNGSTLYYVSTCSNCSTLYKYDTILKTVTECTNSLRTISSLLIVNGILYMHGDAFYSFDGTSLRTLAAPENVRYAGLFEFEGQMCCVGGGYAYMDKYPVYCFDLNKETWTIVSYSKEGKRNPGVATTKYGTMVFGGNGITSNGRAVDSNSIEIFNHSTKIWRYVPTPPAMDPGLYTAISFYY